MESLLDVGPVKHLLDALIPEYSDLRTQVRPFLSGRLQDLGADNDDDDDDDDDDKDPDTVDKAIKRRRFSKKGLDETGAFDIAEDID